MGFSITVLGCCGSYPGPGGACSGYLVRGETAAVWVDAGSGTLANLQRHVQVHDVDAVVLSHEHPDHWADLESFFVACRYIHDHQGVAVYAPAGLKERSYYGPGSEPWFAWHEVTDGDTVEISGLRFTFSRTDHPPETLAMRIEGGGRSVGYSADSGPDWSLEALGPGLDLAICEASFQKEQEGTAKHMSARQAGRSAQEAAASRLVLTHLWPTLDAARSRAEGSEAFGEPVELAAAHQRYEI